MTDVIEGNVTPVVVNAAVNAGGKLLKAIELQLKFGKTGSDGNKSLILCGEKEPADPHGEQRERLAEARRMIDEELARMDAANPAA